MECGGFIRSFVSSFIIIIIIIIIIIRVIKSRIMRWTGHVTRMGAMRSEHNIFHGKPEGKRQLGRPRRKREDNKMDHREIGWADVD
jgi:hypothetical protein